MKRAKENAPGRSVIRTRLEAHLAPVADGGVRQSSKHQYESPTPQPSLIPSVQSPLLQAQLKALCDQATPRDSFFLWDSPVLNVTRRVEKPPRELLDQVTAYSDSEHVEICRPRSQDIHSLYTYYPYKSAIPMFQDKGNLWSMLASQGHRTKDSKDVSDLRDQHGGRHNKGEFITSLAVESWCVVIATRLRGVSLPCRMKRYPYRHEGTLLHRRNLSRQSDDKGSFCDT